MYAGIFALSLTAGAVQAKSPTLTVYTYDSFTSEWGPGPAIQKAFEARCGCELNYVALDDGVSILNRLRLEGHHSQADIVLGLDDSLMAEAKQTGLFAKHHVNTAALTLPNGWHDDVFIPYDYGYFAFVYRKDRLPHPPQSLKALVGQSPDLKIIYQDPRTSTPGQGLLLWMKSVYGEHAAEAWQQLAKKTVTVTKGWSEAYSMFLKGESDMVLSYTTSPAYHQVAEQDDRYAAAEFSEGHYMQVEVAAKLAGSPHQALADQFMQFMLSEDFQSVIPTTNWMYPVTSVTLPDAFRHLSVPKKTLQFSATQVAENRKHWIREWQTALTQAR
ncbi:thiamine ABC transporter substrate binding subunit [Vibrio rhizosphaerae]|uniref:Thiamine-binding periplasmic protein n=1 Tax=Vibrio rhizosphaerae TaxID=398736 RepID=A0ABU4IQT9_9VIBR|nr:thiamine ABC transporter substrate binding subunit [Vibrio rhizosphaerae]MDW6091762.1 thiamine ABC transporter substrate binding subunit [Vibrio rhizosphaerae]